MFEIACPSCSHKRFSPFIRVGAATRCPRCAHVWRVSESQIVRTPPKAPATPTSPAPGSAPGIGSGGASASASSSVGSSGGGGRGERDAVSLAAGENASRGDPREGSSVVGLSGLSDLMQSEPTLDAGTPLPPLPAGEMPGSSGVARRAPAAGKGFGAAAASGPGSPLAGGGAPQGNAARTARPAASAMTTTSQAIPGGAAAAAVLNHGLHESRSSAEFDRAREQDRLRRKRRLAVLAVALLAGIVALVGVLLIMNQPPATPAAAPHGSSANAEQNDAPPTSDGSPSSNLRDSGPESAPRQTTPATPTPPAPAPKPSAPPSPFLPLQP